MAPSDLDRFSLSDDIVHGILCDFATFRDLGDAILSCKSIFNVYKTHPHAILLRLAECHLGPVGLALTFIRLQAQSDEDITHSLNAGIQELDEVSLEGKDAGALAKLEVCPRPWENLYRWRCVFHPSALCRVQG